MTWDRIKSLVVESLIVCVILSGIGLSGEWIRGRINAKIQADEMCATSLRRIADAAELLTLKLK